jgi:hypothetical protein
MWNEAAVAYFKILSRHLPLVTEKIHEHLRMVDVPAEIRTWYIMIASQQRYRSSRFDWQKRSCNNRLY